MQFLGLSGDVPPVIDATHFTSWQWLARVTAYVLQFIHNLRVTTKTSAEQRHGPLQPAEIKSAEKRWIKEAQRELTDFKDRYADLTPLLQDDIVRVGGRLRRSSLAYDQVHPATLRIEFISNWQLYLSIFQRLNNKWGPFTTDLFASRLTAQLARFVSWKPDPEAEAVDAFTLDWSQLRGYAFPPFTLTGQCLRQVLRQPLSQLTIVTPVWETQPWYPLSLEMSVDNPVLLPPFPGLLRQENNLHPLAWRTRTEKNLLFSLEKVDLLVL